MREKKRERSDPIRTKMKYQNAAYSVYTQFIIFRKVIYFFSSLYIINDITFVVCRIWSQVYIYFFLYVVSIHTFSCVRNMKHKMRAIENREKVHNEKRGKEKEEGRSDGERKEEKWKCAIKERLIEN